MSVNCRSCVCVVFWIFLLDTALCITLVPPKLMPLPKSAQLKKGERYHVTCSTSDGSPPMTISWSKNGETIDPEAPSAADVVVRKIDDFSTSLVVENVQSNHAGNYSCIASNPAGRDTATTRLQVLFAPTWVRTPTDISALAGSKISLSCEASGSPKPTITWRKNSDFSALKFDVIHSDTRLRISDDGQSLQISEATKKDEGFYECHITNGVGDSLKKTVRVELQVPPKVAQGPSEIIILKGKDVNLDCNMTGDPPLNIVWEKNGKKLESKPKTEILELPTGTGVATTLTLNHVERETSGLYVCKAKNTYGEAHRSISVDVVEQPGPPRDFVVSQVWSRSLQLTWATPYSGNRQITAYVIQYWKTEGKSEPPPEKPSIFRIATLQTTAVVTDLLPNTIYSLFVMAENEVGMSAPSQTVTGTTREEEPDWNPMDVTVLEKHGSSVKLRWKCPTHREWIAPLKGYYVGYRRKTSKIFTYRTLEVEQCHRHQEYILRGLQRASSYYVSVKAFNIVGAGPQSEQIEVHTADGGPPRSPDLKLISTAGITCNLRIIPKDSNKNLPTEYGLHLKEQDGTTQKLFVSVLASRNYSVGGLRPGTQYEIAVTARNEFGESAPSQTLKIITDKTDPNMLEFATEQSYDKIYFILPIILSAVTIVVLPILACYCLQKSTSRQMQADSIEVRDFIYNAATIARIDATMRRASATMSRPVPNRLATLPRSPRTGRVETTTLPTPDQPQQAIVEMAPTLPTSYSTLQNYGTATATIELDSSSSPKEDQQQPPHESPPERNKTPDDLRYDSVVEEMRTLLKEGVTRPKKAVPEESSPEESS